MKLAEPVSHDLVYEKPPFCCLLVRLFLFHVHQDPVSLFVSKRPDLVIIREYDVYSEIFCDLKL